MWMPVLICCLLPFSVLAQNQPKRTPWHNTVAVVVPRTNPSTQAGVSQAITGTIPLGYVGTVAHVSARCTAEAAVSIDITIHVSANVVDPGELPPRFPQPQQPLRSIL